MKTCLKTFLCLILISGGMICAPRAMAHSVWIEPNSAYDGELVVRFAEPDGRMERSPGHLDELTIPVGFSVITNQPIRMDVLKSTNHFRLIGAQLGESVCVETSFTVLATPGKPARRPVFYARWVADWRKAMKPALNLDLVPTGILGEVRVYFKGKPLAGVKATLRTPDEVEKEVIADAEGFVRFECTQRGQHHLSISRHRENLGGFHGGNAYEITSHNASVTWKQP